MSEKGASPFTPGNPVPVELFVGRAEQIIEMMNYVKQTALGRQENIFLVGERGIGKTSISSVLRAWAKEKEEVISIHVFLGGVSSLDEMARRIYEALLKATHGEKWFDKIRNLFGEFVNEVGMFGVSVGFSPPKENLSQLVRNFPQSLQALLQGMKDEKKALFIVLDDLDTLSTTAEFAHWYKSFVDEIATHYSTFPLLVMLIGLPNMMDSLANLQPSLMRIFRVIELENLSNNEVSEFFRKAFQKIGSEIDEDALMTLVRFSSGLPIIMQEIGDATFWADQDNKVNEDDAIGGVVIAAGRIGKKYLDPQVYRALRSDSYRSILGKLSAGGPLGRSFSRQDVAEHLTAVEKKVLDNFLRRLRQIGIIEPDTEKKRGSYRFVNDIYPIYIWMQAKTPIESAA
jgi:hypothetical protein